MGRREQGQYDSMISSGIKERDTVKNTQLSEPWIADPRGETVSRGEEMCFIPTEAAVSPHCSGTRAPRLDYSKK